MKEVWKDIEDLPHYQVSNFGAVRIKQYVDKRGHIRKAKIRKPWLGRRGLYFTSHGKTYAVHRLVAQAFIPNPHNLPHVMHIDKNVSNNNASNLKWVNKRINNPNNYIFHDDYAEIVLNNCDETALIDLEDVDLVSQYHWHKSAEGYVIGSSANDKQKRLHRLIIKTDQEIDHINRNPLDNRKSNLRTVTRKQNSLNRVYKKNTSGYKGVEKTAWGGWRAHIRADGKSIYGKTRKTLEQAINDRIELEKQYWKSDRKYEVHYEGEYR